MEMAPLLSKVPKRCPMDIQKLLDSGEKVNLFNRCCVFEDFFTYTGNFSWRTWGYFHEKPLSQTTKMSLDDLFGRPKDTHGNLYHLHCFRQSWKYLELGGGEGVFHLRDQVILEARESLAPSGKRVAIHLRVTDSSKANGEFHFPGPGMLFNRTTLIIELLGPEIILVCGFVKFVLSAD